jgi:hypothetical protein
MSTDHFEDEMDHISARTLASTRYKRNHEFMNDVFRQAAFGMCFLFCSIVRIELRETVGDKTAPPPPPPYFIFDQADLDEKVVRLIVLLSTFTMPLTWVLGQAVC